MNLYTNNDVILCRVFLTSLKGAALTWNGGLPPRSIDNFDSLVERFNAQYATNRSHRITLISLASQRQADNKSLKKFIERFGRTAVQIQNLNPNVALHSMLLALRPSKFANNLCKNHPVTWTSCASEPKATSRWKKCLDSRMKSVNPNRSMTSVKEIPRLTCISQIRDTSQASASLSPKGTSTSDTHP